jgi:cytidyltransferase-like protein
MNYKTVVVFGTFDGLHPGHIYFLNSAKAFGENLVVVVARDKTTFDLKEKKTKNNEEDRLQKIKSLEIVDEAYFGDKTLGDYNILKILNPNIIVFGHDQHSLKENLLKWYSKQDEIPEFFSTSEHHISD